MKATPACKANSLKDLRTSSSTGAAAEAGGEREAARRARAGRARADASTISSPTRAAGACRCAAHGRCRAAISRAPTAAGAPAQLDEQRVLHEAISDEFDAETLLDIDDALSFRRPRHRHRRDAQAAQGRLEHPGRDRPARPAPRRGARSARRPSCAMPTAQRLALRARGARQGPRLAGQEPVLKAKVKLADAEERGAGLRAGPRRRRRRRRPVVLLKPGD